MGKIESLQDAVKYFTDVSREAADAYAVAQKWKAKTEAAKAVMWFWVDHEKDQRKAAKAASRGTSAQNSKPETKVDRNGSKLVATGSIKHVEVKKGTGKRGPWTRYAVLLDNEEWYTTFDKGQGEKALAAKGSDTVYEVYYVVNSDGYKDLETLFPEGSQPDPAEENEQNNHQGDGYGDDIPF
jgi:hypothetical protein